MSFLLSQHPVLWVPALTALIGGYLSGSVPYGLLLSSLSGLGDIRRAGSGNIGATNVLRLGGKKLGAATLLLDMLKGFVPVMIAARFGQDYAVLCALGAFFGHLYPVWLKFKGGKGVATAIGVLTALSWPLGVAIMLTWAVVARVSGYSSLSSLSSFGLAPVYAALVTGGDYQTILTALIVGAFIWLRHRDNIKRLAAGTEGKINLKGPRKTDA